MDKLFNTSLRFPSLSEQATRCPQHSLKRYACYELSKSGVRAKQVCITQNETKVFVTPWLLYYIRPLPRVFLRTSRHTTLQTWGKHVWFVTMPVSPLMPTSKRSTRRKVSISLPVYLLTSASTLPLLELPQAWQMNQPLQLPLRTSRGEGFCKWLPFSPANLWGRETHQLQLWGFLQRRAWQEASGQILSLFQHHEPTCGKLPRCSHSKSSPSMARQWSSWHRQ